MLASQPDGSAAGAAMSADVAAATARWTRSTYCGGEIPAPFGQRLQVGVGIGRRRQAEPLAQTCLGRVIGGGDDIEIVIQPRMLLVAGAPGLIGRAQQQE